MNSQRFVSASIFALGLMAGVVQGARAVAWFLEYETRRKPWQGARVLAVHNRRGTT